MDERINSLHKVAGFLEREMEFQRGGIGSIHNAGISSTLQCPRKNGSSPETREWVRVTSERSELEDCGIWGKNKEGRQSERGRKKEKRNIRIRKGHAHQSTLQNHRRSIRVGVRRHRC